jgi:hypothetical protein
MFLFTEPTVPKKTPFSLLFEYVLTSGYMVWAGIPSLIAV